MDPAPVIAAGLGCRPCCPLEPLLALLREAARRHPVQALAVPDFRQHEPALLQLSAALRLPLHVIPRAALEAMQPFCPTRSAAALRHTGLHSVAEAAALALGGPPLLQPRFGTGPATCAIAGQ